ncbi:hypothetical protein [Amycolatopsis sp. CA-128772]|uniref:hypothetical protein n=1 Tax=Amycolatopsis sp. CA-128772 TaxID=2073159 RepID=UPI001E473A84|nr:hypothetical protein [Amycolatopsis sp. CA-128772]
MKQAGTSRPGEHRLVDGDDRSEEGFEFGWLAGRSGPNDPGREFVGGPDRPDELQVRRAVDRRVFGGGILGEPGEVPRMLFEDLIALVEEEGPAARSSTMKLTAYAGAFTKPSR